MVIDTESQGRVLLLDGVIQCADRDEFSYQEMLTHLGLCSLKVCTCYTVTRIVSHLTSNTK